MPTAVVGPEVQEECSVSAGVGDVGGEELKTQQGPGAGKAVCRKSLRSGGRQQLPRVLPVRPGARPSLPLASMSSSVEWRG